MVTIYDIAKEAGVTPMTVTRILSGGNKENRPSSIARGRNVREIAARLGYRPNTAARAVSSGRFRNIGLILSSRNQFASMLPPRMGQSLEQALRRAGFHLTLSYVDDKTLTDAEQLPLLLQEASVDGLLVHYTHTAPKRFTELLAEQAIPTVWINAGLDSDSVSPDDYQMARLATEYLVEQGHRRIVYLDTVNWGHGENARLNHHSAAVRERGYRDALQEQGLEPQTIYSKRDYGRGALPPIDAFLGDQRPTAIVSYSPFGLEWLVAKLEHTGSIPQIVTFSGQPWATGSMPVSTVCVPEVSIAQRAVKLLLRKIEHPSAGSVPAVSVSSGFFPEPGLSAELCVSLQEVT